MPIQPLSELFDQARSSVRDRTNEIKASAGSSSGDASRFNRIPAGRTAVDKRNLIRWLVPEFGFIDMYINPENIIYTEKKSISKQRTKGGFVMQYWGEDLGNVKLSGTTGSSGVEGINVLYDVYRSEQLAFDPYALALSEQAEINQNNISIFGDNDISSLGQVFTNSVANALESGSVNPTRPKPTLASLAFSVEMYWSGWVFRGFFENFTVTESIQKLGMFDYSLDFTVTQRRGTRYNFMPWHRSPVHGPSNSDPNFGVPYSYDNLVPEQATASNRQSNEALIALEQRLLSSIGYINK